MTTVTDTLKEMPDVQLAALALSYGWSAGTTTLYDEEAVEGWRWESPDLEIDLSCIGEWDHPHMDDAIREAIIKDLASRGISQGFSF
jgi:hypothetical protein